jgi:hypothetical protein
MINTTGTLRRVSGGGKGDFQLQDRAARKDHLASELPAMSQLAMMADLNVVPLLAVLALTIACTNRAATGWQRLSTIEPARVIESPARAVEQSKPVPTTLSTAVSLALSADDPVVQLASTKTFFEVVSVQLATTDSVRVEVESDCNCFGFSKSVFVPLIVVFDESGREVSLSPGPMQAKRESLRRPVRLLAAWTFVPQATGVHRVLIASDNTRVGSRVVKLVATDMLGTPWFPIDVVASAAGSFSVLVKNAKSP